MPIRYNAIAGKNLDRLIALSDGVFAFAMTLLVLDLRVPSAAIIGSEQGLIHALIHVAPRLVPYLMSFMTLGIFWMGQQAQFNLLARSDRDLGWTHIAFLAVVALVPFSTALLAEFIAYRTALLVYWANILLLGALLLLAWMVVRRRNLLKPEAPPDVNGRSSAASWPRRRFMPSAPRSARSTIGGASGLSWPSRSVSRRRFRCRLSGTESRRIALSLRNRACPATSPRP
jgi:uncharacterized membrane protein